MKAFQALKPASLVKEFGKKASTSEVSSSEGTPAKKVPAKKLLQRRRQNNLKSTL